jgi:hypothetical protein
MLLVLWKRLIFGPPFLLQINNDAQTGRENLAARLLTFPYL